MAQLFLSTAGFAFTVMSLPAAPDSAFCEKVASAGPLAITSIDVGAATRDCLVAADVALLSFDGMGDQPPTAGDGLGQVLSTRRGLVDSIVAVARWVGKHGIKAAVAAAVLDAKGRRDIELLVAVVIAGDNGFEDIVVGKSRRTGKGGVAISVQLIGGGTVGSSVAGAGGRRRSVRSEAQ